MTTLAHAMLEVARVITHLRESVTTAAGTTTTLVDTTQDETSDFWNNGLVWFLSGALAGKTAVPTDYDKATGTITLPTQTAAPGSGSRYAVMGAEYSRSDLVRAINLALDDLRSVPQENQALTVVSGQEEYTLPNGVRDVRRVLVLTNLTDPFAPKEHFWWTETAGGKLRFDAHIPATADSLIRVIYSAPAAEVSADMDVISDTIPLERLKWSAAVNALRGRYIDVGKDSPTVLDRFKEALDKDARAKNECPIPDVPRAIHMSVW